MKYILLFLTILALSACKETTSSAVTSGLSVASKVSAVASN